MDNFGRSPAGKIVLAVAAVALIALMMRGGEGLRGLMWGARNMVERLVPIDKHPHGVNYGVYDPEKAFADARDIAVDHIFLSWNHDNRAKLRSELSYARNRYARNRDRWLMVTIEPWPKSTDAAAAKSLLSDIADGVYDPEIKRVCGDIGELGVPLFIRWGHEMEVLNGRYPWSGRDAESYIAAYRHFVTLCRGLVKTAYYVWSPAGDPRLVQYWPGGKYVDYVGLSVYGFPQRDLDLYGEVRSFNQIFSKKYERVVGYEKPIMIAELGVTGGKQYQTMWMDEMFRDLASFPKLRTVVYFNSEDKKGAWEARYAIPDWRIDSDIFE